MKKRLIPLIFSLIIVLAGCKTNDSIDTTTSNNFNIYKIHVGDKIGSMTVVSINTFTAAWNHNENTISEISTENIYIQFSNKLELTGTYNYIAENPDISEGYYFYPDIQSRKKLPLHEGDLRDNQVIWFRDINKASNLFKYTNGKISVIIDNFCINSYPGEVFNTATPLKIKEQ